MELKKRWIALIVLILGLTAALESSPRTVVLRTTLPPTSTCPCNDSPYGTSMLLDALRGEGMDVVIVSGPAEVRALNTTGYDSILLLSIAADAADERYASQLLDALESHGKQVFVAVVDEYPSQGELALADRAARDLCSTTDTLVIARIVPSNPNATAVFRDGVVLQTGYTSYISRPGSAEPVLVSTEPRPAAVGAYTIDAWVWPALEAQDVWAPLAARCTGAGGGVLLVADSSIFINEAFQASSLYREEAVGLIKSVTSGRTLVVVDAGMYLSVQARIAVEVHPSFLIVGVARVYSSIEHRVLGLLGSRGLIGAVAVLAGVAVLLFSWGSSQAASGVGEKRARMPQPPPLEPAGLGCDEVLERARRSGLENLIDRIPDPEVKAEAMRLYGVILEECADRGLLGGLKRLLPGRRGRAGQALVVLLGLLGLEPIYEVEGAGR